MTSTGAVVTAYDQGDLVAEAVASVLGQSRPADEVMVVDDGSSDDRSLDVLERLDGVEGVRVVHQPNAGVSSARNAGLGMLGTELAVVLDGDDTLAPDFVRRCVQVLDRDRDVVAVSSWMRMHGVVDALVKPTGGAAVDFLHRNACPATVMLRRDRWLSSGGYDESMRAGFEDWDFFLSLLAGGGRIEIVPEPLVRYRTAPASANLRSMDHRLELYGWIIDRHRPLFDAHLRETILQHEAKAMHLLARWERLMVAHPTEPLDEASYGDGGMAAAVRIAAARSAPPR